jgi:membrane protein DedA with SNARE-associated domain
VEQQILNFIYHIYQTIGWPGVVLLMAIESACIPLPSEIIMPLAGWMLIANRGLGIGYLALLGLAGAIGNLIGSLIAYGIGYHGGVSLLKRYGKYILISNHDIERASLWFNKYGERIVFLSRLVPAVRTFISLPAGIARMKMGRFVLYSFAGSFPWSFALAYGGYVLGQQNWERIREVIRPFDIPILGVFLALVIFFVVWRLRRLRGSTPQNLETNHSNNPKNKRDTDI